MHEQLQRLLDLAGIKNARSRFGKVERIAHLIQLQYGCSCLFLHELLAPEEGYEVIEADLVVSFRLFILYGNRYGRVRTPFVDILERQSVYELIFHLRELLSPRS